MTPLKAATMKELGNRRLRRRVLVPEAADQDLKDLESLELKDILRLYKDLFNTDPPRKNKFLMVKKIKVRHKEMEEESAAAGGPKAKTNTKAAPKARAKAKATPKVKAPAAPKAKAKAKPAPKAKAKAVPKAKAKAVLKVKAKAKPKAKAKAKPKPKPKAKPAAASKEANKGGSAGELPQRALRAGKRKNYSEDLKVSVDAV